LKRVIVDTDDVLRDFVPTLVKVYKKYYPDHEVNDIDTWTLSKHFPIGDDIYDFFAKKHMAEIFYDAPFMAGAMEFLETLHKDKSIHIILATSQKSLACRAVTMQWYLKHNIPHNDVYFTEDKSTIDANFIIDDSPNQLTRATLKGMQVLPFTQAWNVEWQLRYLAEGIEKDKQRTLLKSKTNEEKYNEIYSIIKETKQNKKVAFNHLEEVKHD